MQGKQKREAGLGKLRNLGNLRKLRNYFSVRFRFFAGQVLSEGENGDAPRPSLSRRGRMSLRVDHARVDHAIDVRGRHAQDLSHLTDCVIAAGKLTARRIERFVMGDGHG